MRLLQKSGVGERTSKCCPFGSQIVSATTKQREEETNMRLQQERIRKDESEQAKKVREEALKRAKQMLDTTEQAFRHASENIPSGATHF
jgi:hypothetical protein